MVLRSTTLALALVLAACSAVPDRAPDITGMVTGVVHGGSILVEERPADRSGSAKASVRLSDGTSVWRADGTTLARARADGLALGQTVRVWFDGPAAMSYPVQATAKAIVIVAP